MNSIVPIASLRLALRASVAAGACACRRASPRASHPLYAAIAAVIVTDLSPRESTQLGRRRLVATVVGAICGASLSMVLQPGAWAVGASILFAMLASHLVRAPEGAKVAGYISGIVVMARDVDPWFYAFFRFLETALGISIAWAISYVPKLIKAEEPENRPS
jgi:uncharacterized membrane protein YgaE (UPF0421/DUF939 family)